MFTKNPTRSSTSARLRPAIGTPTAMSLCPLHRANTSWNTASAAMNNDALCRAASSRNAPTVPAGTVNTLVSPTPERTRGRGRSVGSSKVSNPANRARQ
nr:hypothetical protein [Streptomyces sp. NRRL S-87]